MLPGDGASGEEYGIDRGEVVVLGVQREHEEIEDQVGEAEPARVADGLGAEQSDYAGDPKQSVDRTHVDELREEEAERAEGDVLVVDLTVVQELVSGPVVVDLPEEVRQGDGKQQTDAHPSPARSEYPAFGREQKTQCDRYEEDGHGGFVEQADARGEPEDWPPKALRVAS